MYIYVPNSKNIGEIHFLYIFVHNYGSIIPKIKLKKSSICFKQFIFGLTIIIRYTLSIILDKKLENKTTNVSMTLQRPTI